MNPTAGCFVGSIRWAQLICALGLCAVSTAARADTNCVPPPAGLVTWWAGEGNALDWVWTNHGTLAGQVTYGPGRVGQEMVFDGNGDAVQVGNPISLQLQDFTIDAWIKRASPTVATADWYGHGSIFAYGNGGYGFGLQHQGDLYLTKVGTNEVTASTGITNLDFHHVAVTKSENTVVFYVDGVAYPAGTYAASFAFYTPAAIGARGGDLSSSFLGTIDEVGVYRRALAPAEIQAMTGMPWRFYRARLGP